jgi:hypothetical protein
MLLFAGDGESSSTGAARDGDWSQVRTRSELAALINDAAYVKEEPVDNDNNRMETGEEDGDVVCVRTMEGLLDGETGDVGDMDDERAEALMDEEEEVSVVDTEEGEEDEEGDEVMREAQQGLGTSPADRIRWWRSRTEVRRWRRSRMREEQQIRMERKVWRKFRIRIVRIRKETRIRMHR